jgi:hypothetical protein
MIIGESDNTFWINMIINCDEYDASFFKIWALQMSIPLDNKEKVVVVVVVVVWIH